MIGKYVVGNGDVEMAFDRTVGAVELYLNGGMLWPNLSGMNKTVDDHMVIGHDQMLKEMEKRGKEKI